MEAGATEKRRRSDCYDSSEQKLPLPDTSEAMISFVSASNHHSVHFFAMLWAGKKIIRKRGPERIKWLLSLWLLFAAIIIINCSFFCFESTRTNCIGISVNRLELISKISSMFFTSLSSILFRDDFITNFFFCLKNISISKLSNFDWTVQTIFCCISNFQSNTDHLFFLIFGHYCSIFRIEDLDFVHPTTIIRRFRFPFPSGWLFRCLCFFSSLCL